MRVVGRTALRGAMSLKQARCSFSSVVPTSPPPSSLLDRALRKLEKTFLPHSGPLEPIVVFDALHCDEFWEDDWICTSDKSYGGPSYSTLTYAVDSKEQDNKEDNVVKDYQGNSTFHGFPFLRFMGSLDMSSRKAQELGVSGGFCALRGEVDCPDEISDYEGFEIIYRNSIQMSCIVNVTMENMTPEDVYQTRMTLTPKNMWMKLHIPLSSFRLTLIGKDREAQGVVEGSNIDTFGILIRNHEGPFCLDIHSIKVVEKLESEYVVEDTFKRPSFFRQLK